MSRLAVLHSSERLDWPSPAAVLDPVRELAGGQIGLDPCGSDASLVRPRREYRLERGEDGLALPWTGHGLVYVNPPYGRELPAWVAKACAEAARGAVVVLLVPSRTDTAWFAEAWARLDGVCFWRGRLTFEGAREGAPFPSALFYAGPHIERFRGIFGAHGRVVVSPERELDRATRRLDELHDQADRLKGEALVLHAELARALERCEVNRSRRKDA